MSLINPRYRTVIRIAVAGVAIAAGMACLPFQWARIIGMTTLVGVLYGILNDCIACRVCIEYFTIGHVWDGKNLERRALLTLNPWLTALACGTYGSWHVSALGGIVLSVACCVPLPGASRSVDTGRVLMLLAAGAAAGLVAGEGASRYAQIVTKMSPPAPGVIFGTVPPEMLGKWRACSARNSVGYIVALVGLPLLSLTILAIRKQLI